MYSETHTAPPILRNMKRVRYVILGYYALAGRCNIFFSLFGWFIEDSLSKAPSTRMYTWQHRIDQKYCLVPVPIQYQSSVPAYHSICFSAPPTLYTSDMHSTVVVSLLSLSQYSRILIVRFLFESPHWWGTSCFRPSKQFQVWECTRVAFLVSQNFNFHASFEDQITPRASLQRTQFASFAIIVLYYVNS